MVQHQALLLLLCLGLVTTTMTRNTSISDDGCKLRFVDNKACACGDEQLAGISCKSNICLNEHDIDIDVCYCMYYDSASNMTLVAQCYYTCLPLVPLERRSHISTSTDFNDYICDRLYVTHRNGSFCAKCENDYGLAAYSYTLDCVPCNGHRYESWLKYFAIALLPLTVFYVAALFLSFNVTSSRFNGIVLILQVIMSPVQVRFIQALNYTEQQRIAIKIVISICAILNLDFFQLLYEPFCLNPNFNIIETLSLNYIVALYPFLLIFLTYVLVTLYDREYRLLIWMWRPFKICSRKWLKNWNIRDSLIGLFATFLLLSYVKILTVSTEIIFLSLGKTDVYGYNVAGKIEYVRLGTLYDANIEYLGAKHLPFVLLALVISFSFVLLPFLLLLFYPCGCFHRLCLNRCGGRCRTLHVFMDVFQGSYRTRPRDMRYFAAFYLFLRVLMLAQWQIFLSYQMLYMSGIISIAAAAMVTLFQPYSISQHNSIDSVLLTLMGVYYISYYIRVIIGKKVTILTISEGLSAGLLILYFLLLLMWKLFYSKLKLLFNKCKSTVCNHGDQTNESSIEPFHRDYGASDRHTYSPLLSPQQIHPHCKIS